MCLIVFQFDPNQEEILTVSGNRDEFYQRKTQPAHFWEDGSGIYGGKDLELGGTWLGVTKAQRFAAVTNYREPGEKKAPLSRGAIPTQFLTSSDSAENFCQSIESTLAEYAGFNALLFDGQSLWYCSNRHHLSAFELEPGIYGLSNHLLNSPWPKVESTKQGFRDILSDSSPNEEALISNLQRQDHVPDENLPNTGVGLDRERFLSTAFIKSPFYGTRASTIVRVYKEKRIDFTEQNYGVEGLTEQRTKVVIEADH